MDFNLHRGLHHMPVPGTRLHGLVRSLAHVRGRIVELEVLTEGAAPAMIREELAALLEQRAALQALVGAPAVMPVIAGRSKPGTAIRCAP